MDIFATVRYTVPKSREAEGQLGEVTVVLWNKRRALRTWINIQIRMMIHHGRLLVMRDGMRFPDFDSRTQIQA